MSITATSRSTYEPHYGLELEDLVVESVGRAGEHRYAVVCRRADGSGIMARPSHLRVVRGDQK